MRTFALAVAAALGVLAAGCSSGPGLADYTAAGYDTPAGYEYPSPSEVTKPPPGMEANPGAFDISSFPIPASSDMKVEDGYVAYLSATDDESHFVASVALRLSKELTSEETTEFRSMCDGMGSSQDGVFLVDGDVLSLWTWSEDSASRSAGQALVAKVKSETGATALC